MPEAADVGSKIEKSIKVKTARNILKRPVLATCYTTLCKMSGSIEGQQIGTVLVKFLPGRNLFAEPEKQEKAVLDALQFLEWNKNFGHYDSVQKQIGQILFTTKGPTIFLSKKKTLIITHRKAITDNYVFLAARLLESVSSSENSEAGVTTRNIFLRSFPEGAAVLDLFLEWEKTRGEKHRVFVV